MRMMMIEHMVTYLSRNVWSARAVRVRVKVRARVRVRVSVRVRRAATSGLTERATCRAVHTGWSMGSSAVQVRFKCGSSGGGSQATAGSIEAVTNLVKG
jgi:hypothetical protein